jgi:hypothetical protein
MQTAGPETLPITLVVEKQAPHLANKPLLTSNYVM